MNNEQFYALAQLMRLRFESGACFGVCLVVVHGKTIGDAARTVGLAYKEVWTAHKKFMAALALARVSAGVDSNVTPDMGETHD